MTHFRGIFPDPTFYRTWQLWAAKLNKLLEDTSSQTVEIVSYTVATLPSAALPVNIISVTDEVGGATLAFNDGTNWRRVQDRAIVA